MKGAVCPLCSTLSTSLKSFEAHGKTFLNCHTCSLIFTARENLPDSVSERLRYQNHNNQLEDEGYVKFLNQIIEPALRLINPSSKILDYGCGPQPVLSQLLNTKRLECDNYDPFFYPEFPAGPYDVIFSTEVFEHFHQPAQEILKLNKLLAPCGLLVIMTEFHKKEEHFKNWWYARDFTHVSFYNLLTFDFIADRFEYSVEYTDNKRVVILKKV